MCGVFGVYLFDNYDIVDLIKLGLYDLQHRGQEAAGIAVLDQDTIACDTGLGLVTEVSAVKNWSRLSGRVAIGHTRYSTTGLNVIENASPMVVASPLGPIAISYNGNLVNPLETRRKLDDTDFLTTTDTEIIARDLVYHIHHGCNMVDAILALQHDLIGAYSLAILTQEGIWVTRDPYGIRPLSIGQSNQGIFVSSETCAFEGVNAEYIREVENGEILLIDSEGYTSFKGLQKRKAICIFEFIYIARPDSNICDKNLYLCREECGRCLAREHPPTGDIVVPMMNTALAAALGYGCETKCRTVAAHLKNRYHARRSFIQPNQDERQTTVAKSRIIGPVVKGLSLNLVEDSVVRATTTQKNVQACLKAGATDVDLLVASPPYRHPCFYGIDTAVFGDLAFNRFGGVEGIRSHIQARSLRFLSFEGLCQSIGLSPSEICAGCLTGEYPTEITDEARLGKMSLATCPR